MTHEPRVRSGASRLLPHDRRTRGWVAACAAGTVAIVVLTAISSDGSVLTVVAVLLVASATLALVDARLRDVAGRVVRRVDDTRAKQSRHEYHQERTLEMLRREVAVLRGDVEALVAPAHRFDAVVTFSSEAPATRVLLVTSNGSGMGHVVRSLAVGCALPDEVSYAVLTLSTAHAAVREAGFPVTYFPSQGATGWSRERWNRLFAAYLRAVLGRHAVTTVVFDGTYVYRGVTDACRIMGVPLVWLRRGLWKDGTDRSQFDAPTDVADHVLVPADLGEAEPDGQEGDWLSRVPPITLASRTQLVPGGEARKQLGLDPDKRYVLVQVGRASFDGTPSTVESVVEAVRDCVPGMSPAVLLPPTMGDQRLPHGVAGATGRFPLAPQLSAFELAVSAAGYNSVHENIEVGLPSVFIPYRETLTDDQVARASQVARAGMGLVAHDMAGLRMALTTLADVEAREALRARLAQSEPLGGARAAARYVHGIAQNSTLTEMMTGPTFDVVDADVHRLMGRKN